MTSQNNKNKKTIRIAALKRDTKSYLSASALVEASLVIPVFIFAVVILISMILNIGVQLRVRCALYEGLREAVSVPYTLGKEKESVNLSSLKPAAYTALKKSFTENMSKYPYAISRIDGGTGGIFLDGSEIFVGDAGISVKAKYNIKLPLNIFGAGMIAVVQDAKEYAWLGEEFMNGNAGSEKLVYITPHGTVYHEDRDCTYIAPKVFSSELSAIPDKRNAGGEKYRECEHCTKRAIITPAVVYITEYGNRYHTDPKCIKIKHEIIEIPISQVGNRRKCSKE